MKITLAKKFLSKSKQVVYLIFNLPSNSNFEYKNGQFVMLETVINWKPIKRAYSIVSTYSYTCKTNQICFLVKKVSENGMSNYLTQTIKEQDNINMYWPFWHMTNDYTVWNYLFLAIWSWRASIIPIIVDLLETDKYKKIYAIFGERYFSNVIDKLENTYNQNKPNYKVDVFFSKENISTYINKKNITYKSWHVQDGLDDALKWLNTKNIKVFMCGKPQMVDKITEYLIKKWISKDNILSEKY